MSSPLNPMANGHAESGVKAMKHLVMKTGGNIRTEAFLDGLREWCNTPKAHGQSPSEIVFGRSMRSSLPALTHSLEPPETPEKREREEKVLALQEKKEQEFNSKTRALPKLAIGTRVFIQDQRSKKWDTTGVVVAIGERRSYDVRLENGKVWTRNRRYLRPRTVVFEDEIRDEMPTPPPTRDAPKPRRSPRRRRRPDRYRSK